CTYRSSYYYGVESW
nr:immunoglobulin heavy chain junction region [Macaca mulatta]MOX60146.1 immunoglobulin heavy chain junction region [Macaca mulatta]MOX61553.1 immunoglobulin heavy chain junction region [Macaca mulatta]MOX66241.1 immunoglobulin heavy chain junction region [Macaca mulatta]